MTIKITLKRAEILFDIHNQSHHECLNITDVEERYRKEAGSDKTEELNRFIAESVSELHAIFHRWIADDYEENMDDVPEDNPGDIVLELDMSARRTAGKAKSLTERMHSFIVNRTLGRYYSSVGLTDLAQLHTKESEDTAAYLERIIYQRNELIL